MDIGVIHILNQMKLFKKMATSAVIGASFIANSPAQAENNQHTCFTQYDEAPGSYSNCDVTFRGGEVMSIKDYSSGVTFRAGEHGWIPAKGNCLRNLESGSKICINN